MTYLILLLSGIVSALPLIFEWLAPLSWFSMIPMIVILLRRGARWRDLLVWGIGYYGLLYHWFICLYPLEFAGLNAAQSAGVVAVAWIGLTVLQAPVIALAAPLFCLCCPKSGPRGHKFFAPFLFAGCFTLMEWLQTQTWMGVPMMRLSLSQTALLPVIGSASLFGSLFLSFLIVAVNGLLASAICAYREKKLPRRLLPAALAALLFAANFLFGALWLARPMPEETVKVAVIQGNIASGDKWADNSIANSVNTYLSLSEKALTETDADLVVWPETVVNITLRYYPKYYEMISDFARTHGVTLIVGTFDESTDDAGNTRSYNALLCFGPDGSECETAYYKRHLVPFGEYLPMEGVIRAVLPSLAELNVLSDPLTPGENSAIMESPLGAIGGLICFDSIYETLAVDSVRDGAELIVLSTNDSWYRDSAAVYQHCRHAVLRAVESGRYIVRAAATGISAIISPSGEIRTSLPPLTQGCISGSVALSSSRTLYSYIGNLFVLLCALGCAAGALCRVFCHYRRKKRDF